MTESLFEKTYADFVCKGDMKKIKWLESLPKKVLPSMRKRIQANDKTVLQELVLPKWVKWQLLYSWATENAGQQSGKACVLCSKIKEVGIKFNDRFVCEACYKALKSV